MTRFKKKTAKGTNEKINVAQTKKRAQQFMHI